MSLRRVTKAYGSEITAYNLTHGQFFLMIAIIDEEGLLPREFAEQIEQDRAAIAGVVDRLEKVWLA